MKGLKKGYKDTELGIIPEDWKTLRISEMTDIITGGTPSTLISQYWGGKYKWMNSGELNNKFIYDVEGRITEIGLNNSSTHILPINCVLIGLAGQGKTRGTVAINYCELCTNQSIAAILPQKEFIPLYLYYNLDNRYNELRASSTGEGGRGGLNKKTLLNYLIPIPSIQEQQAIAKALSDIDALIDVLNKLIEKKKNIKQGAMQELLTGKKRLQGFSGKWEIKTLEKIGAFYSGYGFPIKYQGDKDSSIPFLKVSDLNLKGNEKYLNLANNYISKNALKAITAKTFPKNTIVLAKIGAAIFLERKRILSHVSCIDNNMMGFVLDYENYDFQYMYYTFLNLNLSLYANTTALPSLNGKELSLIEIQVPPTKEEQSAIAKILTDMDNEIEQLEKKRDKYLNIKSGMMQQLLTGQIRLINVTSCSEVQKVKIEENSINNRKKHSKQFDEAVIISFLVDRFGTITEPLSRFMYTKLSYLIHRKHDCIVVDYKKFAAGPYNPKSRYGGPEKIGKEKAYFDLVKDAKGFDAFIPQKNIQEAVDYFIQWYGANIPNWVEQFRQYKPWDLETLATVDMAINDLEEKGVKATISTVKTYLSSIPKWKAKLDKPHFSNVHIQRAINESIRLFKI